MRSSFGTGLLVLTLLALSGCVTAPKPILDPFDKAAQAARPSYEDYHLTALGHAFWGMTFVQGSDTKMYYYPQIVAITKASEETKKLYDSAVTKSFMGALFAGIGGYCTGYVGGYALSGKPWNAGNSYILAGGVGSILISYLIDEFATNDFRSAVGLYNAKLQTLP